MRLSKKVHPALDGEFLEALQLRDIFTVTDFLSTDPECVVNLAAGTFDGDIEDLREDLIEKFSPKPQCAVDLLPSNGEFSISSGVPDIDGLVGGSGFESGHIYELFGPPDSGKTQLALSLAAHCALSRALRTNVLYLDVKGDFSAERLSQIIRERSSQVGREVDGRLDKVRLKRIFTIAELTDSLDCVEGLVRESDGHPDPFWVHARLLVIDNVASLVYPEMDDDHLGDDRVSGDRMKEIFGGVQVAVGALQKLASEHRMCVLIINNAVAGNDDDEGDGDSSADCLRPSLGRILNNAADVRLKVTADGLGGTSRTVSVERGMRLVPGATCKITLTERGWDERNRN